MRIGFWEMAVLLIVALLVIGPDKLPEYMKSLGKGLVSLRKATNEISKDIQSEVVEPLKEVAQPLKEAVEPIQDTVATVNEKVNQVNKTIHDLEHPVEASKKRVLEKKADDSWVCPNCNKSVTGNFCSVCGSPRIQEVEEPVSVEVTNEESEKKEESVENTQEA